MKAPKVKATLFGSHTLGWRWELPADAESYERMVEQMDVVIEEAINRWLAGYGGQDDLPRAALRAIGITAPKHGKKGSK